MIVIDASAAVQASLTAEGFALLAAEDLIAPRLLWSEAPSALHELFWRRTISAQLARQALDRFLAAPIVGKRPARLTTEAWRIADDLGWAKTYDAEYVALARLTRCRLLTVDARLRRGAARIVEIVTPADL